MNVFSFLLGKLALTLKAALHTRCCVDTAYSGDPAACVAVF